MPSEKTTPDVHVGNAQEPVLTVGEEGGPRAPAPPAAGEVRSRAPLTEEERAWEEVRRQPAHEHRPPPLPFRVPRPNTASGSGGESTATEGEWRSPELLEAQAAMEETSAVRPITDAAEALAFQRREDDDVWRAVEVVERMARFLANPKDEDRAVVRHACDVIRGGRPGQANGPLWRALCVAVDEASKQVQEDIAVSPAEHHAAILERTGNDACSVDRGARTPGLARRCWMVLRLDGPRVRRGHGGLEGASRGDRDDRSSRGPRSPRSGPFPRPQGARNDRRGIDSPEVAADDRQRIEAVTSLYE